MALMVKVEFRCPSCNKIGILDVDSELLEQTQRGVLAITVPSGKICPHSFVAYIDKNLDTRDCFLADFFIEIPELREEKSEEITVPEINKSEIEIVKLNLPATVIVYVIRALFLKQEILLLSDKKHLYDYYQHFFEYITQDSFDLEISFIPKIMYKLKRKEFKEPVVIGEDKEIVKDANKVVDLKKLKIEKNIVHEFFKTIELLPSLIVLKNEIFKIYKISKTISDIAKRYRIVEMINQEEIHESLEELSINKFHSDFLNLLIEVVEEYFDVHVPISLKVILKKWKKKKK